MLYGLIESTVLHVYAITQVYAVFALLVIAKYVPETNMPTKLGKHDIYANYLTCIYLEYMCMHVPHMKHMH